MQYVSLTGVKVFSGGWDRGWFGGGAGWGGGGSSGGGGVGGGTATSAYLTSSVFMVYCTCQFRCLVFYTFQAPIS